MAAVTKMIISLDEDTKAGLDRLAAGIDASPASLASQAIEAYVEQGLEDIRRIEAALTDIKTGNVAPHEDAMSEINALIEAARAKHA